MLRQQIGCALTILYFGLESARGLKDNDGLPELRGHISTFSRSMIRHLLISVTVSLSPRLLNFLPIVFDRMRWDESVILPKRKVCSILPPTERCF